MGACLVSERNVDTFNDTIKETLRTLTMKKAVILDMGFQVIEINNGPLYSVLIHYDIYK